MFIYLYYIFVGIICGIFIGTLGVGSGILTIPLLMASGMDLKSSIAVVLAHQLVPQTVLGVREYYKRGYYKNNYAVVILTLIGSFMGVYYGAIISTRYLNKRLLKLLFLFFLIIVTFFTTYKYYVDYVR